MGSAPNRMGDIMKTLFSLAAAAVVLLGGASVARADLPTFELNGLPITQHQLVAVQSAQIRERTPTATLTVAGMPASPHQMAVLAPRPALSGEQITEKLLKAGLTQVRLLVPANYTVVGLQDGSWVTLLVNSRTGEVARRNGSD